METILSILYFIIVLGILVFVHELGHFLMARFGGMRVETFALGMGFRLFGWNKKMGFTFGNLPEDIELEDNTDYRIAAFPIGGYCKISGVVDESFDTEFAGQEPKEWEFRSKGPFKKALAISGGVLFNVLLAIGIFSFLIFQNGEYVYNTNKIGYVSENSIAKNIGLQSGDEIISINKQKPTDWSNVLQLLTADNIGNDLNIVVKRNKKEKSFFVDGKDLINDLSSQLPIGLQPVGVKTVIVSVLQNGLAIENGISENDTIIAVNSELVASQEDFISKLKSHKNEHISLTLSNNNGISEKNFTLNEEGTLGVQISSVFTGKTTLIEYNVFQAVAKGTVNTFEILGSIISSIKQIFIGNLEFKQAVGGPIMIAKQASLFAERGLYSFLTFTAMLSISLALLNILPFPALDGGHLIIIIIEAIIQREIPVKTKLIIQQVGLFILVGLMAYVIFNDFQKLL